MSLVIRGGSILAAARGGSPVPGTVVVGDNGRIESVTPAPTAGPARAGSGPVLDASGCTVLPGLIDMHVHLYKWRGAWAIGSLMEDEQVRYLLRAATALRRCLSRGITTVRDLGSASRAIFDLAAAVDDGLIPGPRVIASGRAITSTGGHGWQLGGREADGVAGVTAAVREQLKHGAQWIKLIGTGGAGTPGKRVDDLELTTEEMTAGVAEAHRKGRRVTAHISSTAGARAALDAGVDGIEHGLDLDDEVLAEMAARGVYLCPTVEVYERMLDPALNSGFASYMATRAAGIVGPHRRSMARARELGVPLIAGTDSNEQYWPPGDLQAELERMVEFGCAPAQAIDAATGQAARCLGLDDEVGTLAPGLRADILVVRGDPVADITALRDIVAVVSNGIVTDLGQEHS